MKSYRPSFESLAGVALVVLALPLGVGSCCFLCNSKIEVTADYKDDKPLPPSQKQEDAQ